MLRLNTVGEYVTLETAARALGRSYYQVRYYVRTRHIPTAQVGRSTLVRLPDLAGMLRGR